MYPAEFSQLLSTRLPLDVSVALILPETSGIPHGRTKLDIEARNDLFHGNLDFLAIDRVRDLLDGEHEFRDVAGAQTLTDGGFDPADQRGVETAALALVAFGHDDEEEDGFVLVVFAPAAHAQRVGEHGVEGGSLDDVVDLGRAEADAARVEDAVGAAQDLHALGMRIHKDEVVLGPDVEPVVVVLLVLLSILRGGAEFLKVGFAVFAVVRGVAPEAARHRGEGVAADEFAGLAGRGDRLARRRVENVAVVAQRPHLHFIGIDGSRRVGGHPGTRDVGAAGYGGEVDRGREGAVEPLELLAREGRARGGDEAEAREVKRRRSDARLLELQEIAGTRAPVGGFEFVADPE